MTPTPTEQRPQECKYYVGYGICLYRNANVVLGRGKRLAPCFAAACIAPDFTLKPKRMGTKPTCANCEYFINEDGMPYCAVKDLYTEARADDKACISFTFKRSKNGV